MTTPWYEFLAGKGATFSNKQVDAYGNRQAELLAAAEGSVLVDMSHLGLLQVEGADAVAFLQGQVTSDIKQLDGSNSQYSGYCNPKGRMLGLFLAFSHHDHIHLQLNGELLEPLMKRLRMYVLRSKVVITDVSDSIIRLGVAGQQAGDALQKIFERVPQQPHEFVSLSNGALLRLPGPVPRYEIFCDLAHAPEIWTQLESQLTPAGKDAWEWLEIQAGIPDITPRTQEAFVPQMVNLDALDGISFKKGCYTGQEIVARTHYLGKVKRRTQLAHIDGSAAPQPGDILTAADGAEAGQVVRSAAAPGGGYDVLAEIRLESREAGDIRWQEQPLKLAQLPYAVS